MKAIILAAGRGSRMECLTDEVPKCLIKMGGVTLLEKQIYALEEAGIKDISIVGGYKIEQLTSFNRPLYYNKNWSTTNMVYSLMQARELLESGPCIVSYGDIFYTPDIVKKLIQASEEVAVAYDINWLSLWQKRFDNVLEDAETFKKDQFNNIIELGKVPKSIEEIEGQYMGLLKFQKNFWVKYSHLLPSLSPQISMTNFLNYLIECGVPIEAVENNLPWGEVDNPMDIEVYK